MGLVINTEEAQQHAAEGLTPFHLMTSAETESDDRDPVWESVRNMMKNRPDSPEWNSAKNLLLEISHGDLSHVDEINTFEPERMVSRARITWFALLEYYRHAQEGLVPFYQGASWIGGQTGQTGHNADTST